MNRMSAVSEFSRRSPSFSSLFLFGSSLFFPLLIMGKPLKTPLPSRTADRLPSLTQVAPRLPMRFPRDAAKIHFSGLPHPSGSEEDPPALLSLSKPDRVSQPSGLLKPRPPPSPSIFHQSTRGSRQISLTPFVMRIPQLSFLKESIFFFSE